MNVIYIESNEKKNSGKELKKIHICWKKVENDYLENKMLRS